MSWVVFPPHQTLWVAPAWPTDHTGLSSNKRWQNSLCSPLTPQLAQDPQKASSAPALPCNGTRLSPSPAPSAMPSHDSPLHSPHSWGSQHETSTSPYLCVSSQPLGDFLGRLPPRPSSCLLQKPRKKKRVRALGENTTSAYFTKPLTSFQHLCIFFSGRTEDKPAEVPTIIFASWSPAEMTPKILR